MQQRTRLQRGLAAIVAVGCLVASAAPSVALSSASAPRAKAPRYSGTITVTARESAPGGGLYSAYEYDATARLPFAFSGTGPLSQTRRLTAALTGHYRTTHPTSDYRRCKGPNQSGPLRGKISYYLWPTVLAKTVTFSFGDLGETMTPNYRTVCGLPQTQAGGANTLGLLGNSIDAAAGGPGHKFTLPARGGKVTKTGRLRNNAPGDKTVRTYTVTVALAKIG